jgi:hypothetical protein
VATQDWLVCQPGNHRHIWRDPKLNLDFVIPESFMEKIRTEIDTPLEDAQAVIRAALEDLPPDSVAWIILNGYLHPEPEEV